MLAGSALASYGFGVLSLPVSLFSIILSAPLGWAEDSAPEIGGNRLCVCVCA